MAGLFSTDIWPHFRGRAVPWIAASVSSKSVRIRIRRYSPADASVEEYDGPNRDTIQLGQHFRRTFASRLLHPIRRVREPPADYRARESLH